MWVRETWIGVELDCFEQSFPEILPDGLMRHSVHVSIQEALTELRKKNKKAAKWFQNNSIAKLSAHNNFFSFGVDEIKILEGKIIPPSYVELTEEDRGDRDR